MRVLLLLSILFYITSVYANNILALLKRVENNHTLHMSYKQQPFICKPYGVETVSELILRTDLNSSCRKYIYNFRLSNPQEKYFATSYLFTQQQYGVTGIDGACMLYISNEASYSEALLENGYARMNPLFLYKDPIIKRRFKQAVLRAKSTKAGIWADIDVRNCFLVPKK